MRPCLIKSKHKQVLSQGKASENGNFPPRPSIFLSAGMRFRGLWRLWAWKPGWGVAQWRWGVRCKPWGLWPLSSSYSLPLSSSSSPSSSPRLSLCLLPSSFTVTPLLSEVCFQSVDSVFHNPETSPRQVLPWCDTQGSRSKSGVSVLKGKGI